MYRLQVTNDCYEEGGIQLKKLKGGMLFLVFMFCLDFGTIKTEAKTSTEVISQLNGIINEYEGTKWTRSFAGGTQCYAFAHFVFDSLFDRGTAQVGNGAVSSNSTCYKLNNIASDIKTIGILSPGYSQNDLSNLLEQVAPGDYIQVKRNGKGGPHSMIAVSVNATTDVIEIIDANSDGYNTVKHYTQSVSYFKQRNAGVSVYRYAYYDFTIASPSNPQISKNQIWFDLSDTIEITAFADNATSYYMSMFKDNQKIIGTGVDGGKFSMPANQYGEGNYSAYFSCTNSKGSVDTQWVEFSVVGPATYSDIWSSKPIYELGDTVSISVSTVCAKGQVIGIDKDGVGRVVTTSTDSTYTIKASDLGMGTYSAYFSVYNGSGGIDTKRITFIIEERSNLGEEFYAKIKNIAYGKVFTNDNQNVKGADSSCGKAQLWKFVRQNDGSYKILSQLDNMAMDVENYGAAGNGTNVHMYHDWVSTAQQFVIYRAYGGYYLKSVSCDLFLDLDVNEPNNVTVWGGVSDWSPQKFEIIKVDSAASGDHQYTLVTTKEATCKEEGVETHTCSVCGDTYTTKIEKKSHSYSEQWTTDILPTTTSEGSKSHHCTVCDAKTDVTVIPILEIIPTGGVFSIISGSGRVDDIAEVYIKVENNPGIVGATLCVAYDTEKLQLISCEDQGVLNDYQWSELDHQPFMMNWEDPLTTVNNTANGNIAKLQFKILQDLGDEGTELKLTIDTVYDVDIEDVLFTAQSGKITMSKYKPGDINDDGTINSKDSILLRKFVLGGNGNVNSEAADVNKDGAINSKDSILLRKYILGANVELK